ncbi:isocitrate lyase/phosphoenolpyruvate mutase family protein [Actinomycetospora endophytica]|uniref:Isocitrate lyase/phosphoenolpyruvate mutase family protein n=1 Tax=Actinomycetospora endophytica TaxID=2291215 RepID=A0ABS8PIS5_9PSEU|nr:isocitrate lyase/phosphoenolpyruvate mutase family protein [Actinomycetospora endophytica]MCD2198165.1 isocitrate lyase/phosphoenolpyruvate mutase family protein [Actinomycetospora endophytica]
MVDQSAKAAAFRALHEDGTFVLPNAWDAGSAAMIEAAGAPAVATTSAGVSWAQGRPDGQNLSRDEMVAAVAGIVSTVELPVSADVEGGYGEDPDAVAATVRAVIGAGAVGINLEDSRAPGGPLFDPAAQAARIRAAREAAADAGLPGLVINARTDVFLFGIGEPDGRLEDVLARAAAYTEAGADSLFVPGLLDLDVLTTLTGKASLPVNVMVGPGAPDVATLRATGVRRISLGQAVSQAAYSLARRAAAEALTSGTYDSLAGADDFGAINGAFAR